MRLTERQRQTIKSVVAEIVGSDSRVWLFGSRLDDNRKGGDIDLLIETDRVVPNRASTLCKLDGRLAMRLGDRKFDLLLKDAQSSDFPIHGLARAKGVRL
jgi:predicted nucleotidyltransferase